MTFQCVFQKRIWNKTNIQVELFSKWLHKVLVTLTCWNEKIPLWLRHSYLVVEIQWMHFSIFCLVQFLFPQSFFYFHFQKVKSFFFSYIQRNIMFKFLYNVHKRRMFLCKLCMLIFYLFYFVYLLLNFAYWSSLVCFAPYSPLEIRDTRVHFSHSHPIFYRELKVLYFAKNMFVNSIKNDSMFVNFIMVDCIRKSFWISHVYKIPWDNQNIYICNSCDRII